MYANLLDAVKFPDVKIIRRMELDTKGCDNAGEIAKKEFYNRRSPLKLLRYVGNNEWEEFIVREMTIKN